MKATKFFGILSLVLFSLFAVTSTSTVSLAKETMKKETVKKADVKKASVKKATAKKVVATKAVVKKKRISKKALYIKVQKALNGQGAALKADGKWGRKSRAALKMYQKKNGLKATGRINKATRSKLLGAA